MTYKKPEVLTLSSAADAVHADPLIKNQTPAMDNYDPQRQYHVVSAYEADD